MPGREALLAFIGAQDRPLTRSEIARTYGLKGDQRAALRRLLQTLEDEGMLERGQGRRIRRAGGLPPVTVIEVTHVDEDGEAVAVPANWSGENAPPTIVVRARRKGPAAETGQRLLARIRRGPGGSYTADPMRRVDRAPSRAERGDLIGVLRRDEHRMLFVPADRSMRGTFSVAKYDRAGALEGDLVVVEATVASR
ncbi:MAG: helix-turn-helix domain-containing protein, partial [Alphaproteobacteria bacterium]|nr:helix-turn-helix domain-containing protein [Alphaproteobacteria bacterium]